MKEKEEKFKHQNEIQEKEKEQWTVCVSTYAVNWRWEEIEEIANLRKKLVPTPSFFLYPPKILHIHVQYKQDE